MTTRALFYKYILKKPAPISYAPFWLNLFGIFSELIFETFPEIERRNIIDGREYVTCYRARPFYHYFRQAPIYEIFEVIPGTDIRNGRYRTWHYNGQLATDEYYVNDELNGEMKQWFPEGKLRQHCFYKNGYRHGEGKYYHTPKALGQHKYFINGEPVKPFEMDAGEKLIFTIKYPGFRFFDDQDNIKTPHPDRL